MTRTAARRLSLAMMIGIAAAWRLTWLELRPIHHDEAVNWFFIDSVMREGGYVYDPQNYHGPLHFQVGALVRALLGDSLLVLRLPVAIAGVALVAVMGALPQRTQLASRAALMLAATSPTLIYYARDAIHETWLALSSLVCLWATHQVIARPLSPRASSWAWAAGAALGAMIAIKETFVITLFAWAVAGLAVMLLHHRQGNHEVRQYVPHLARLVTATLMTTLFSYTNGLQDIRSLTGLVETWNTWAPRGIEGAGHDKPFPYYAGLLWQYEAPVLLLCLLGLCNTKGGSPLATFRAGWAVTVFLVYSAIPYKTPWLVLQLVLPAILLASSGVSWLVRRRQNIVVRVVLVASLLWQTMHAWTLNVRAYDEPDTQLAYVQTHRELHEIMEFILALQDSEPGSPLRIHSVHEARYPMNYYLRGMHLIEDERSPLPDEIDGDIVLCSPRDEAAVWARLSRDYVRRSIRFRGHLGMIVFVDARHAAHLPQTDLWQPVLYLPESFIPPDRPDRVAPGLRGHWFYEEVPLLPPDALTTNATIGFHWPTQDHKPSAAPIFAYWEGWLEVEVAGEYTMNLASDDGARLWLGGQLILDNWGRHALNTVSSSWQLDSGSHHVRLAWFDIGGLAHVRWTWRQGQEEATLVPETHLSHDPTAR